MDETMDALNNKLFELTRIANLQCNYDKTLLLLAALKDGSIELDHIELIPGGWNLTSTPAFVPERQEPLSDKEE